MSVKNLLSFSDKGLNREGSIELADFNLFVGSNNAGKSNVLRLPEIASQLIHSVSGAGNEFLENMAVALPGKPEDWVFAQDTRRKATFSFSLEIEESDQEHLGLIQPYNPLRPER